MKKNLVFIGIIFLTAAILSSCKIDVKQEKTLHRPDVEIRSNEIAITGTYDSTAIEYINVFRLDKNNESAKPVNIGLIFPSGFNTLNKTYSFYDNTAIEGRKYSYFCRFYEGKYGYYTTEQSLPIEIPASCGLAAGSYSTDDDLKCNMGTSYFTFNEDTKILALQNPGDFRPAFAQTPEYTDYCLVVTNGTVTESFRLSQKDDWSDITPSPEWNLQLLLPESFFNKEIQILGLISQKVELVEAGSEEIKRLFWTNITSVDVKNETTAITYPENKFIIEIQSGSSGIDYGYTN